MLMLEIVSNIYILIDNYLLPGFGNISILIYKYLYHFINMISFNLDIPIIAFFISDGFQIGGKIVLMFSGSFIYVCEGRF